MLQVTWPQVLAWRMKRQSLAPRTSEPVAEIVRRCAGIQAQVHSAAVLRRCAAAKLAGAR